MYVVFWKLAPDNTSEFYRAGEAPATARLQDATLYRLIYHNGAIAVVSQIGDATPPSGKWNMAEVKLTLV